MSQARLASGVRSAVSSRPSALSASQATPRRHVAQHVRHLRLEQAHAVQGLRPALDRRVDQAREIDAGRVHQQRHRPRRGARQVQPLAFDQAARRVRPDQLAAQRQAVIPRQVQRQRLRHLVETDQQIGRARGEGRHRVVHVARLQAATELLPRAPVAPPARQVGRGQGIGGRQPQLVARGHRGDARARLDQLVDQFDRRDAEALARLGQLGRKGGTVDQPRAGPVLQALDAAAERRLRQIAGLGRAREVAQLRQGDEVLQPPGIHTAPCAIRMGHARHA